jgi:glucose-1-phosphate adenylyltransferase
VKNIVAMVLAGGKGERLYPLTLHRAKPAVPFGGKYRIIDFTLSNCINSGIRKIAVLTQYKSLSLDRHLRLGWDVAHAELGEFIISVPPQQRIGKEWYRGTADAIYQNLYMFENDRPEHIVVLSGDHIYKMDYSEMVERHKESGADATVAVIEFPREESPSFGVIEVDSDFRVVGFQEKPKAPKSHPSKPEMILASMGVYVFTLDRLIPYLEEDSAFADSEHDFGKNVLPRMVGGEKVVAFNFIDKNKKYAKYWRDVGTLDAYWEANIDLVSVEPLFNLYDREWPIRTYQSQYPPAKFVFAQEYKGGRLGVALDSIVCGGCIISGGRIRDSVLSPNVRVNSYADVRESVLMEDVVVGRHARLRRVIVDKDVVIPPLQEIGYDLEQDRKRFTVTESGIVVVSKGTRFDEDFQNL